MIRKTLLVLAALTAGGLVGGCEQQPTGLSTDVLPPPTWPTAVDMSWPESASPRLVDAPADLADAPPMAGVAAVGPGALLGPVDNLGRFRGQPSAQAQTLEPAQQHSFSDIGVDVDPDVDASGQWIVFTSTRHNIAGDLYLKRVDGVTVTQLTSDSATDVQPAFSPSGRQIAFTSDAGGNWDIWLIDIDGRNRIRLTDSPAPEIAPAWSPDGRRLAYCVFGQRSHAWEIWVMDLSRPGARTFLGYGLFPAWSPDRKVDRIAFQRARQRGDNDFSIWTVDLIDGEPRYPTEVVPAVRDSGWAAICPFFSHDGKRLCFTEIRIAGDAAGQIDHASAIAVIDADGTNRQRLTEARGLNANPSWSADGKIYFTSDRQGRESIFSITPTAATPAQRALANAVLANQPATATVPVAP